MKLFEAAYPFQDDVLALPVDDLDATAKWYADAFGLQEVERSEEPVPTVILERDGVRIGFAINGGDASMDGAAILVTDIKRARADSRTTASRSRTGVSTSGTARSSGSSSSSRRMGSATTSISRSEAFRPLARCDRSRIGVAEDRWVPLT